MFKFLQKTFHDFFTAVALKSYGWQSRRTLYLGSRITQWQDPYSSLWYSENTALKLMKVQALDEFYRR